MKHPRAMTAILALTLLLAGCAASKQPLGEEDVKAADFPDWPLTVPGGRLQCKMTNGGEAVQIYAPPYAYALNGTAKSFLGAADLNSIWADQAGMPGLKKDATSLLEAGRKLCHPPQ